MKLTKQEGKPRKKWKRRLLTVLACFLVLFVAVAIFAPSNQDKYDQAVTLVTEGEYDKATELLTELADYEDSQAILTYVQCAEKAKNCSGSDWAALNATLGDLKLDAKELQKPLAELKEQAEVEQTAYEQEQAEQQEAEDVMDEIDGLADLDYQVSALESSQKAIQTVRTHYDQCSQSVQARITNYDALKQAEQQIEKTVKLDESYQKQAEPVIKGIQALGTVTLNSKSQLDQLTAQYKALPKDCQAYVTNYDTLKAGNASYEKLKKQYDADQKAAAEKAAAQKAAQQKAQQSQKNTSGSWENSSGNGKTSSVGGTVYWTPGGSVYHKRTSCPSLARSKTIYSGSVAESGKSRGCKNCCK